MSKDDRRKIIILFSKNILLKLLMSERLQRVRVEKDAEINKNHTVNNYLY
tara:strand:- start:108 stop:257 length:150 start_codon:yes stop_codon:yes gene_type:complete